MNKFEKAKLYGYIANMLSSKGFNQEKLGKFVKWHIEEGYALLPYKWNLKKFGIDEEEGYFNENRLPQKTRTYLKKQLTGFKEELLKKVQSLSKSAKSNEEVFLDNLQKILHLSPEEKEILGILLRYENYNGFGELLDMTGGSMNIKARDFSFLTGYSEQLIDKVLSFNAPLSKYDLIEIDDGEICLSNFTKELYARKIRSSEQLKELILGDILPANLVWEDFEHIQNKDFCLKILQNAIKSRETGINILLYGEPGTGKTEFVKTLCKEIGVSLYAVGENFDSESNKEDYRKQYLDMTQLILKNSEKMCLLIDEADDIFDYNKLTVNRMLETNFIPRIWIINSIALLDKAYLRRFSYAMNFEKPDLAARTKMWQKSFQKNNFQVTAETAKEFAVSYFLPPSFISSAVRSVRLAKGGLEEVKNCLNALEQAYNNGRKKHDLPKKQTFNPALINTSTDLLKLANQLAALKRKNFSLCLYGASGTGKSAYAEYLAEKLGLNIVKKQCSSLLGMYVGQTEQNIAMAFQEARDSEAMLVFDEADSFLQDRNGAYRSWEITQVNEMLTQMENFEYPFVCTTNLMDKLDKASLRRFTFKVKYNFMKEEQVEKAFQFFFGKTVKNCMQFTKITAGDFVVVKNKAEILGCLDNEKELKTMLLEEQRIKDLDTTGKKLGFL